MLMVVLHLLLGFLVIVPFLIFGFTHLATSWNRPNKSAVRFGLALLATSLVILISGLVLVRIGGFEVRDPRVRDAGYWLHVLAPLAAVGLYVKHRLAGPMIRWHWARRFGVAVVGFVVLMGMLASHDPRSFGVKGPKEGKAVLLSLRSRHGQRQVHPGPDPDDGRLLPEVSPGRLQGLVSLGAPLQLVQQQGLSHQRARDAAGRARSATAPRRPRAGAPAATIPVPFFSGEFDDPNYDDVNNPTSQAGITCTVMPLDHERQQHPRQRRLHDRGARSITRSPSARTPFLQWVNQTLVKAKPEMHKKTFLKPVIKDPKFCSTCHKVGLPYGVNHYKDFVRGQNHYDTFLLSGVSGHGARSFYYPDVAKSNCAECHMELKPSTDFGAKDFDGKGGREIHDHFFSAPTRGWPP